MKIGLGLPNSDWSLTNRRSLVDILMTAPSVQQVDRPAQAVL